MSKNSKAKGSNFERDIANTLNEIYNVQSFARVMSSGAWSGKSNMQKRQGMESQVILAYSSDIIVPGFFKFSVECKAYAKIDWHNVALGNCRQLNEWVEQCLFDATKTNQDMLIFFKINNQGIHCVLKKEWLDKLVLPTYILYQDSYIIFSFENFKINAEKFKTI